MTETSQNSQETGFSPDLKLLQRIKSRCIECGDCHEWQGSATKSPTGTMYPSVRVNGKAKMVRRIVYEATHGSIRAKHAIRTTCGNDLCVNGAHLATNTTSQIATIAARAGKFSGFARSAKIANSKRARDAKLTQEIATEIRFSEETGPVLAARYGVNRSLVVRIKAGKAWRDYSNPFMGLGARS
jgi:hypothetical protein